MAGYTMIVGMCMCIVSHPTIRLSDYFIISEFHSRPYNTCDYILTSIPCEAAPYEICRERHTSPFSRPALTLSMCVIHFHWR